MTPAADIASRGQRSPETMSLANELGDHLLNLYVIEYGETDGFSN